MRALVLLTSILASGCTLLLQPDYDAIAPDMDGGLDGGPDASDAGDGGVEDAGDGGFQCVPSGPEQCGDSAQDDEDCDGLSNCFDFDCRGTASCCRRGTASSRCLSSGADFVALPVGTTDILFSDFDCTPTSLVDSFGPAGRTRALVTPRCEPITFGMELSVEFEIEAACAGTCDYAALSFAPVRTLVDGEPFPSELRVVVRADGWVGVDRAGTPLGSLTGLLPGDNIAVQVTLEPGPDPSGQDVLFAEIDVVATGGRGGRLLERTAVAPLDQLQCIDPGGGDPSVGLYVAIEGSGSDVDVIGGLERTANQCSNPSPFRPDASGVSTDDVEACAAGGIGAPALVNYCRSGCSGGAQVQWDLWVDASDTPRTEESFRFVDFGVCGYGALMSPLPTDPWTPRGAGGFLRGDMPSAREPTLLPVRGASETPILYYAYAVREEAGTERYAIQGGSVITAPLTSMPGDFSAPLLTIGQAPDCTSLRDPLLVAHWAPATGGGHRVDGAWLLFTCAHGGGDPDSLGVARFAESGGALTLVSDTVRTDVLVAIRDTYAERGVFAPEGFTQADEDGELTVRLWYLARDERGQVQLAHAQGRSRDLDAWPEVIAPYPANPILAPDDLVLGSCSACAITGATVTPSIIEGGDWQFLISRSRLTATGTVHELVPLLQYAPND